MPDHDHGGHVQNTGGYLLTFTEMPLTLSPRTVARQVRQHERQRGTCHSPPLPHDNALVHTDQ